MRLSWIAAWTLALACAFGPAAYAKPDNRPASGLSDPKSNASERWSVSESWGNGDAPVYTFNADGTFQSSNWNKGQSYGVWARHGDGFVMIWPTYQVFYIGVIAGADIKGDAYEMSGDVMGTFKMRRLPASAP